MAPETAQIPAPRPRRTGLWVSLVLLAVLVWLYLRSSHSTFNTEAFWAAWKRADPLWLFFACAAAFGSLAGRAFRWLLMVRPLKSDASYWAVLKATAVGFTAVILFSRPGEIVRPYLVSRYEGLPFPTQLAAWLLERVYDLLLVLAIFGYTLAWLAGSGLSLGPNLTQVLRFGGWFIGIASLACVAFLLALNRYHDRIDSRLHDALSFLPEKHHHRIAGFLSRLLAGTSSSRNLSSVLSLLLASAATWVIIAVGFFCTFQALEETRSIGLSGILATLGFVAFGNLVQIPGIGGGFQVVMTLVLVEVFRLPLEIATSMSLLAWTTNFVGIVPAGVAIALGDGLKWKQMMNFQEQTPP